jgi:hypothetical protein
VSSFLASLHIASSSDSPQSLIAREDFVFFKLLFYRKSRSMLHSSPYDRSDFRSPNCRSNSKICCLLFSNSSGSLSTRGCLIVAYSITGRSSI